MQPAESEARDGKGESAERKKRGPEYVGHYQIGAQIGHGAFATVHKAMHILTAEVVAVKSFEATRISKSTMAQILAEADLLKGLQHQNIVRFIECAKKKHQLHIVMEYVEEGSIAQLLDEFGCLPESICVIYVPQCLMGLDYLHARNVFHRDIKGSNILITKSGGIKLSDFGVSALATESEKRLSVVGTPYWIPPEVINLNGWANTSDVWSLGCTVIEMLTGSPPHNGLNTMSAMYKIVEEPMPIPEDGPSPALKDFLTQCFVKHPAQRPTAAKLLTHAWAPIEDLSATKQRIRTQTMRIEEAQAPDKLDPDSQSYLKLRLSLRPGRRGGSAVSQVAVQSTNAAKSEPPATEPKTAALSPRATDATSPTPLSASQEASDPPSRSRPEKCKAGWLVFGRDRKRGWIMLHKSILYWFAKEQDPSSDFRKEVQGVVKLVLYNVNVISDTVFEIHDFISAAAPDEEPKGGYKRLTWDDILQPPASLPRRVFTFTCKSKEELLGWVQALHQDIAKHRSRVLAGTEHFGWLKAKDPAKGIRRLFFFLRGRRLLWYRTAEDWSECERGSIALAQFQVRRDADGKLFTLTNANISLVLIAERDDDYQRWVPLLEKLAETPNKKKAEEASAAPKPRGIEWSAAVRPAEPPASVPRLSPRSRRDPEPAPPPQKDSRSSPSKRGHVRKESKDAEAVAKIAASASAPLASAASGAVLVKTPSGTPASALSSASAPVPSVSPSPRVVASPETLQKLWAKTEETVLENSRLKKRNDDLEQELRAVRAERDQLRVANSEVSATLNEIASLAEWLANAEHTPPSAAASVADMRRQLKQALNELKIRNLKKRATERRLGLTSPPKERGGQAP